MFFTSPKSRIKEIQHFLHKKYKYQRDMLGKKKLEIFNQLQADLAAFDHSKLEKDEVNRALKAFEERCEKLFPEIKNNAWEENIEVIFVAIVIALALRTYFLQPFVIPTDSMKPTLWGIPVEPREGEPPGFVQKIIDFAIFGKTYVYLKVEQGGLVSSVSDSGPFGIDLLGYIPFVDRTRVIVGGNSYIVDGTPSEFLKGTNIEPGRTVIPDNSVVANYEFGAGDHVFVNKFIYNFRKPQRGDVFVFTTENISAIQPGGGITEQFYIKRCLGLPGDELRIEPPYIKVNGQILEPKPIFKEIYSMANGYNGYVNVMDPRTGQPVMRYLRVPGEPYVVPSNGYWAMGDNSKASFDSRYWGAVPAENLVGTGLFVYWPFSKRWGFIH